MQTIEIKSLNAHSFEVRVRAGNSTTHFVTVTPEYAKKLTGQQLPSEALISKSFEFLLARESNTSILRSFDLSVIARYFPEYEGEIAGMMQNRS